MLLTYRLVKLIETHSDELSAGVFQKLQQSPKTTAFCKVPAEEFKQRVFEIYHCLGEWLLGKSEADVERRYVEIGARRREQGVPMSQVICAINMTKQHLLEFLAARPVTDNTSEVFGELEVLQLLEQFFDRANYYAAIGYEGSHAPIAAKAGSH